MTVWLRSVVQFFILLASLLPLGSYAIVTPQASAITLTWNPNQNAMTAGYALYYGQANAGLSRIDTGATTSVTITNLTSGLNYSFYVVAYDASGQESDPSNQLTYTATPLSRVQCKRISSQTTIQFRTAPGALCRVEYRSEADSGTWVLLGKAYGDESGNISITDPTAGSDSSRFYRAVRY